MRRIVVLVGGPSSPIVVGMALRRTHNARPIIIVVVLSRTHCLFWTLTAASTSIVDFLDECLDSALADLKHREAAFGLFCVLRNNGHIKLCNFLAKVPRAMVRH